MANEIQTTPEERHQNKVFIYINWTTAAILAIVLAIIFVPFPATHEKFVDIGLGILLGILSSNSGTITGNSATIKKPDVTATGVNPIINNNPPPTDNQTT